MNTRRLPLAFQMSLSECCRKIIVHDCLSLRTKMLELLQRGYPVKGKMKSFIYFNDSIFLEIQSSNFVANVTIQYLILVSDKSNSSLDFCQHRSSRSSVKSACFYFFLFTCVSCQMYRSKSSQ